MTRKPLVSVIIPVYNAVPFLKDTIASLKSQVYSNIEIILIDDGSTDGSYELAMEYNGPNVIVKKNNAKGACAARNYGFELSSGNYIQYLDADDMLSPNKIDLQMSKSLLIDNFHVINCPWGHFYGRRETVKWKQQLIDKDYSNPSQWLIDSWMGGGMGQTAIWLTHRQLIEAAGPWNEELQLNQDGEFFCRVLLKSKGITFVKDCGVYYRSGLPNSISKKNNYGREKAESLLRSYQLYKQHIGEHHAQSSLKKALGNNFLMFMYQYHSLFPDLSEIAENEFVALNSNKMWPVGGWKFKQVARLVGFKMALRIKSFFDFQI